MTTESDVGFVVIGRNEGQRLIACLESIQAYRLPTIYVDSGSTDESLKTASTFGVSTVSLDTSRPFSAARARNAGFTALMQQNPNVRFVHFIDGDCRLVHGWLDAAMTELRSNVTAVAVCGFRREVNSGSSLLNLVCDVEWRHAPLGTSRNFGGDVIMRAAAFSAAGGYRDDVIAAEDDELAVRLRARGGSIVRIDQVSTLHDANMHNVLQWWKRSVRSGHGYAQVNRIHRTTLVAGRPERYFHRELARSVLWGIALPTVSILGVPFTNGHSLIALLAFPALAAKTSAHLRSKGYAMRDCLAWGTSCALCKIPEGVGALTYWCRAWTGRQSGPIEYK